MCEPYSLEYVTSNLFDRSCKGLLDVGLFKRDHMVRRVCPDCRVSVHVLGLFQLGLL
jgi:hypothetical protein